MRHNFQLYVMTFMKTKLSLNVNQNGIFGDAEKYRKQLYIDSHFDWIKNSD